MAKAAMKRWNVPGSHHATLRMGQLRARKRDHEKSRLIAEWSAVTGRPAADWWAEAQRAGLRPGCGVEASVEFLRAAISAADEWVDGAQLPDPAP